MVPPLSAFGEEKTGYIESLADSFAALQRDGGRWSSATERFFREELARIVRSAEAVHDRVVAASEVGVNEGRRRRLRQHRAWVR